MTGSANGAVLESTKFFHAVQKSYKEKEEIGIQ
jgi:hypothetical protein